MADVRKARRDAEKSARETLGGTLVEKAGELGVAAAARTEATDTIDDARQRGEQLVADAQAAAAELVRTAEADAATVTEQYAAAWNAAKNAGWTPAQLKSMGYKKPSPVRRTSKNEPSDTADAGSAA